MAIAKNTADLDRLNEAEIATRNLAELLASMGRQFDCSPTVRMMLADWSRKVNTLANDMAAVVDGSL